MKNFRLTIFDLADPDPRRRFRVEAIHENDPAVRSPHAAWLTDVSEDYTVVATQSQGRAGFVVLKKRPGN